MLRFQLVFAGNLVSVLLDLDVVGMCDDILAPAYINVLKYIDVLKYNNISKYINVLNTLMYW